MKLLTQLLPILIILSMLSCQMRGNNGKKTNGLGSSPINGGAGAGGPLVGDTINNITVSDSESLRFACGVYEEQKKRDEWFKTHRLYDSCGYEKNTTYNYSNDAITSTGDTRVECVNPSAQQYLTSDFCGFFGDHLEADFVELKMSIKFNLTYKAIIIIQNGIIKIEPLYKWFESNLIDDDKLEDYGGGILSLSLLYAYMGLGHISAFNLGSFKDKHFVGTIPGYCNEETTETTAEESATPPTSSRSTGPHAKVTINGVDYNWHMVGFTPFRIPEFSNQYVFSGDCIGSNINTNADENTDVKFVGPVYNNFVNPIHPIEVTNESVNMQKNTGCREVTANFTLGYYKTKSTEYEELEYSNAELDEMCKTTTP